MALRVRAHEPYITDGPLRMPFSFGNVKVTQQPHLFVRLDVVIDGTPQRGIAADGLSPLWFMKQTGFLEGLEAMLDVIAYACRSAVDATERSTVFDLWRTVYERQREWASDRSYPPLLWGYGVSLVERALVDAYCRAKELPFGTAVRENRLGLDLGYFHDSLAGREAASFLPESSSEEVAVRHTVGLTDPLDADDLDGASALDDGLPQTLVDHVEANGIDHFKIKIGGDAERDVARLDRIATVLQRCGLSEYLVTLDANEQYVTAEELRAFWTELQTVEAVASLRDQISYIEQPLPRTNAFGTATRRTFEDWTDRPPIIIDESDDRPESLARALDCGYDGTSHKNVKGVFKGIANACRIAQLNDGPADRDYVLSCEDAANIGPVALVQDLAAVGLFGVEHVERNGHQFFRGLSMFPDDVQSAMLDAHGDLYRQHERGFAAVEINDGTIALDSSVDAPYGYAIDLDPSRFTPLSAWSVEDAV